MAKQRKEDPPPAGSPAWMATYGDLMTLLLCFFVLLFSMSTVDAQKFNQVAASFAESFTIFSEGSPTIGEGISVGNGVTQLTELSKYISSMGKSTEDEQEEADMDEALSKVEADKLAESEKLAEKISASLVESNMEKDVDVNFTSQYVLLTLNGALLFDSGSVELKQGGSEILTKVGRILETYAEHLVEVEGHTDNVPINSREFSDNNELSSGRAISVFNLLVENTTLAPAMIKHAGRGEYVPIADNTLTEGRAKNRRVEIKVYHGLSSY